MLKVKSIAAILLCVYLFISCSSGSADKSKLPNADSVLYDPPAPGKLSKAEFSKLHEAIRLFYDTNLVARGFNGAMLVAKNGEVIFEKYNGYFNLVKRDSLNEHSAFHLASVSKTFTAMATLKLAEQGKLNLDDDVKKYFPSFPYNNITIRMLLSHRSGLPNYLYFMQKLGWDIKKYCTNEDVLNYLIIYKPDATSTPGTHFSYCNTNYALLALIIEKVSGKKYSEFLQTRFFTPLRMYDTYVFSLADSLKAMPSYNWKGRPEGLGFLDEVYGDKNIYSTPEDLLKWDQAMYNNQMFSKETLEAAFTPYSNEKPGIRNYGYGWRMNIYPNGKKIIFHGGWWHGNNTMLMRLIQDSATIIILGNKYNRNVYDAKLLANSFSYYFDTDEQEPQDTKESTTQQADSTTEKKPVKKLKPENKKNPH